MKLQGLAESEVLEFVRICLEHDPLKNPDERAAFAKAVHAMDLVGHWPRAAGPSPQTCVGKTKLKQRARLVRQALRA